MFILDVAGGDESVRRDQDVQEIYKKCMKNSLAKKMIKIMDVQGKETEVK